MKLREFFEKENLIRDVDFLNTYCPFFALEKSIGYIQNENAIEKINKDKNIVGVITLERFMNKISSSKGIVISDNPQFSYYCLHNKLVEDNLLPPLHKSFVSSSSLISSTAIIGNNVFIGEDVRIGNGVIIHDNSYISDETVIDDYAIIGAKGMQDTNIDGENLNLNYAGGVKIGKNCHILSQAIIQKPYQPFYTNIGNNTKVSVKVVIGHGSQVGSNTLIAGNCQIAGNVRIGNNVWIGPSSTLSDNIIIEDNAKIIIGSVVIENVLSGKSVSGNFAVNHSINLKNFIKLKR